MSKTNDINNHVERRQKYLNAMYEIEETDLIIAFEAIGLFICRQVLMGEDADLVLEEFITNLRTIFKWMQEHVKN